MAQGQQTPDRGPWKSAFGCVDCSHNDSECLVYSNHASQELSWVARGQGQRACEPQAQARLQLQAFEAINEVVRGASDATQPLVGQLVPLMLSKIGQTFQPPPAGAPSDARARQQELQVGTSQSAFPHHETSSWQSQRL